MVFRIARLTTVVMFLGSSAIIAVTPPLSTRLQAAEPVKRVPWTTSKLVGSPEPPPPYILKRAFPLGFSAPLSLNRIPDSSLLLVVERDGTIYSFDSLSESPTKKIFFDFQQTPPPLSGVSTSGQRLSRLFSIVFHPDFASNQYCYLCYVTRGKDKSETTHISRFRVATGDVPTLDVQSEYDILTCEGGGHNGCTLLFGADRNLYISIGDLASPSPPDPRNTGQDISDLFSSILRIDVDHPSNDRHYSIPSDNPFVDLAGARGEVYAYGLRNPFRMSFDLPTGDLWVGDVGWEAWEMVYRVRPGGNYGWSIKEGPGDVKMQTQGPTPILPADIALGHEEAASVTGGLVYRGKRFPDLRGTYIFGDWTTRKFWAASFDTENVTGYREIASGRVKPVCFEFDSDGELLILDYSDVDDAAGIYRLAPNPVRTSKQAKFPTKLSTSGLFADTASHQPAAGVASYKINSRLWSDGAVAEYLLAIPDDRQATFYQRPQHMFDWFKTKVVLPTGSVLAKTLSLPTFSSKSPVKRLETQIAIKDELGDWQYYSYRWNDDSTDAELVAAAGASAEVEFTTRQGQTDTLRWQFGSRTSCRICHTAWSGETLGFIEPQLRQPQQPSDSWRTLQADGFVVYDTSDSPLPDPEFSGMVDPRDPRQTLDRRARSYLHANCAHCHIQGGSASTTFDLQFEKTLADSNAINEPPIRGDLGLTDACIIRPGHPAESLLLYRLAKAGSGHMPQIGSQRVDSLAVHLIKQWISQLPQDPDQLRWLDTLCSPSVQAADRPSSRTGNRNKRINAARKLLGSTSGALELASAIADNRVSPDLIRPIVDIALKARVEARELIEPFAAPDQRTPKLGPSINADDLLSIDGNPATGATLFASGVGTCSSCHRIGTNGKQIGPDLSHIASKLKTSKLILDSILQPSAEIEEKYRAQAILTANGAVLVGTVIEQDENQVTLCDAGGKVTVIPTMNIEAMKQSPSSLMPEQLLAPLTAQQAADLLAFLNSLQ